MSFEYSKKPMVSVCVQTYQHADYIVECLESIVMQKVDFPIEILLGEDDSTDGTRDICLEYAARYPKLIRLFLRNRKDVIFINGIPSGRSNFINNMRSTQGKYIALLEGDDYWTDPYKLQRQVDLLEAAPEYAGSFHHTQLIFEDGGVGRIYGEDVQDVLFTEDTIAPLSPFHTSSFVFRKDAFRCPEWFYEVVSADMALFSIVSASGGLKKLSEVMSIYRKHNRGLTSSPAVTDTFQKDRIKLIRYLNDLHEYRHHLKAMKVIGQHSTEITAPDPRVCAESKIIGGWRSVNLPQDACSLATMLSRQELQLLYLLAKDYWSGSGVIIDAGCFIGGSTLPLARGVRENNNYAKGKKVVHTYDLFVADRHQCNSYLKAFGEFHPGDSTRALFDRATHQVSDVLEVYQGDILDFRWSSEKIEILFVDCSKTWELNDHIVTEFFPCLIPGKSVMVQQDFVHPTCPWLAITMEFFSDYFEVIEYVPHNTIVYRLIREIPLKLLDSYSISELSDSDKLYLMDRALSRYKRILDVADFVELECARCILKLWILGQQAGLNDLDRIRRVYTNSPRLERAVGWVEKRASQVNAE
jgi:glycosyltransferase involved in cell wall biosynthesis